MLALNGKPIQDWPVSDPLRMHVEAALKRIKQKKFWKLVFHETKIRPPVPGMPGSLAETSAGINQKATGKYGFDGMEHDITYYKQMKGFGDNRKYLPSRVDFSGTLPLDPKIEADKIFLMTCVFPSCAPYEFLKDFQYKRVGNQDCFYKVEDLITDASTSNIVARMVAKVNTLLYDDDFGLASKELGAMGVSQGIPNALDMDSELLRHKLKELILSKKKGQYQLEKIELFLSDAKDGSFASLRSKVSYAIKNRLVLLDETLQGKPAWYSVKNGEKGTHIFTIPIGNDAEMALAQYYSKRPKEQGAFLKYVETGKGAVKAVKEKEHVIEEV